MGYMLVTGNGYSNSNFELVRGAGFDVFHHAEIDRGTLVEALKHANRYILGGDEKVDADLIQGAGVLERISFVGTGISSFVDVDAAHARKIELYATAGISAYATAEHTVGLLIGVARGLFAYNDSVKRNGSRLEYTNELCALRIGILGMGRVAEAVAHILTRGFGLRVAYHNRSRKEGLEVELGLTYMDLPDIFAISDVVVVLVATTPETVNWIDGELLMSGPPGKYLINTASAAIVEPKGLIAALACGAVRTAAFDGYWVEPPPHPSVDPIGLLAFSDDRFVITPHAAAKTPQTWSRMINEAVQNALV